jgi:hypothetical protein
MSLRATNPPKQKKAKAKPTGRASGEDSDTQYWQWKEERKLQRLRNLPGYVENGQLQSHKQYADLTTIVVNTNNLTAGSANVDR